MVNTVFQLSAAAWQTTSSGSERELTLFQCGQPSAGKAHLCVIWRGVNRAGGSTSKKMVCPSHGWQVDAGYCLVATGRDLGSLPWSLSTWLGWVPHSCWFLGSERQCHNSEHSQRTSPSVQALTKPLLASYSLIHRAQSQSHGQTRPVWEGITEGLKYKEA